MSHWIVSVDLHEGQGQVQGLWERDRLEDQANGWHEGVSDLRRDWTTSGINSISVFCLSSRSAVRPWKTTVTFHSKIKSSLLMISGIIYVKEIQPSEIRVNPCKRHLDTQRNFLLLLKFLTLFWILILWNVFHCGIVFSKTKFVFFLKKRIKYKFQKLFSNWFKSNFDFFLFFSRK